jgi:hypothetical protein
MVIGIIRPIETNVSANTSGFIIVSRQPASVSSRGGYASHWSASARRECGRGCSAAKPRGVKRHEHLSRVSTPRGKRLGVCDPLARVVRRVTCQRRSPGLPVGPAPATRRFRLEAHLGRSVHAPLPPGPKANGEIDRTLTLLADVPPCRMRAAWLSVWKGQPTCRPAPDRTRRFPGGGCSGSSGRTRPPC